MREIQIWILKQSLSYEDTLVHIIIKCPRQIFTFSQSAPWVMKLGLQKLSYRALCHSKAEHGKLRATDIIQHIKLLLFEDYFSYCFNIYMFFIWRGKSCLIALIYALSIFRWICNNPRVELRWQLPIYRALPRYGLERGSSILEDPISRLMELAGF